MCNTHTHTHQLRLTLVSFPLLHVETADLNKDGHLIALNNNNEIKMQSGGKND